MNSPPVILGLDLAWGPRNPSGAVCLEAVANGWAAVEHTCLGPDDEILAWIDARAEGRRALVGIDAPIIAPNAPGTGRPVDRLVSARFARFHAGVYPGNRERCARPIELVNELVRRGWSLDPADAARSTCVALEVYPHAASIGLLELDRIVKYKKGSVARRREGLGRFQSLLHERLPRRTPAVLPFAAEDVECKRGRSLKDLEDRLDAVLCAAMALEFAFAPERCEVLGDLRTGYLVVPKLREPQKPT